MNHKGTKQLETSRLILRQFTKEDADAMYRNWASDDAVTRFLCWPTHSDVEVTKAVLDSWIARYAENDFYQWTIVVKENGDEPIGTISVVKIVEDLELMEIGYCIGKKWWHTGITSEALLCVIEYLFEQVGAQRLEARHDTNNPNSGAVMKKCGIQYEGTLRRADRNNQGINDVSYYSILASEWKKNSN